MAKKKKSEKVISIVSHLVDNTSLVSIRLRTIADEYDALLMANDGLIRENGLKEREIQILLKELDMENSDGLRRIIRAKAMLQR